MSKTQTSPAELIKTKDTSSTVTAPAKTNTVTLASETKSISQNLSVFKKLLDNVITIKSGSRDTTLINGKTSTYAERSIKALGRAFDFVYLNQEDNEIHNELRKFFITHRNGHMSSENGLQGINKISDANKYNRYCAIWILMYELTNPSKVRGKIDYAYAIKYTTNAQGKSPNGFVEYVSQRLK